MASAVLDLPVVVGSRRLEVVSSTYGPLTVYYISRRGSPQQVGWGAQARSALLVPLSRPSDSHQISPVASATSSVLVGPLIGSPPNTPTTCAACPIDSYSYVGAECRDLPLKTS